MNIRIPRSVLSVALLPLLAGCDRRQAPNDLHGEPGAERANPVAPKPALTPASGERAEAAKKLGLKVITGSEDGFRVNSTLVTGEKDAVLIDAQFTIADAQKVVDAVKASGKNL